MLSHVPPTLTATYPPPHVTVSPGSAQHASGDTSFSGFNTLSLISVCALTSPAHARLYTNEMICPLTSLNLVGDSDTSDIHQMFGQTAALFGPGSGVDCFLGGHKLPTLNGSPCSQLDRFHHSLGGGVMVPSTPVYSNSSKRWSKVHNL